MTMMIDRATRPANRSHDCNGAQIRAHCRHLATVVTIRGDVDAVNVDQIGEYIRRYIAGGSPMVLDVSGVSHFSAAGVSLLQAFDEDCRAAGIEWTLIASTAIADMLGDSPFPITLSVHAALHDLADDISSRRRLVLPLIRKSA